MGSLLGWLAERHGVDLADGARAQFTSRGSNRFPAGSAVDVATVSGHRDVSQTACPGDAAYTLVTNGTFRKLARGGGGVVAPASSTTTSTTAATTTTVATTTTTIATTTTVAPTTSTTAEELATANLERDGGGGRWGPAVAGVGALAAAAAGLVAFRARRSG
jgi:hypothetical protein